MNRNTYLFWPLAFALLMVACEPQAPSTEKIAELEITDPAKFKACLLGLLQSPEKSLATIDIEARRLKKETKNFLSKPSAASYLQLKDSWHQLNQALYAYSYFLDLGKTLKNTLPSLHQINRAITAKNIQAGYLDAFGPYLYSGLVFELSVPLTKEVLRQTENGDEQGVSGLYAIEFMIFGDNNQRSHKEYLRIKTLTQEHRELGFDSATELPNNRRRKLLRLLVSLLNDDIRDLKKMWSSDDANAIKAKWNTLRAPRKMALLRTSSTDSIIRMQAEIAGAKDETNSSNARSFFAYPNSGELLKRWATGIDDAIMCLNSDIATSLYGHMQQLKDLPDDLQGQEQQIMSTVAAAIELVSPQLDHRAPK